jgi:hypothetical protein
VVTIVIFAREEKIEGLLLVMVRVFYAVGIIFARDVPCV